MSNIFKRSQFGKLEKQLFIINIVFPWLPTPHCVGIRVELLPALTALFISSPPHVPVNTPPSPAWLHPMLRPVTHSLGALHFSHHCPTVQLNILTSRWYHNSTHRAPIADRKHLYTLIKTWQGFPQRDGEESACVWEVLKNGKYYCYDDSQRLFSGFSF